MELRGRHCFSAQTPKLRCPCDVRRRYPDTSTNVRVNITVKSTTRNNKPVEKTAASNVVQVG
jgi:hypothetical protein